MLMKYSSGDRTGALRLYERCVTALAEELAVKPERQTTAIYEQMRTGRMEKLDQHGHANGADNSSVTEMLDRLRRLQLVLAAVQKRVQRDIAACEQSFRQD